MQGPLETKPRLYVDIRCGDEDVIEDDLVGGF